ncbi:MAG: hypothetical protein R3C59_00325 [Planctomycetaceae bacterium]
MKRSGARNSGLLDINNTEIYGKGMAAFGREGAKAPLKIIHASSSQFGYQGFIHLNEFPELEELHISGSSVTDGSMGGLTGQRNLRVVRLGGNMISDAGVKMLSPANPVVELDLSKNQGVSDKCLQRLKSFRELKSLNVDDTSCSLKGVQTQKKALPDCEIQFQQQRF